MDLVRLDDDLSRAILVGEEETVLDLLKSISDITNIYNLHGIVQQVLYKKMYRSFNLILDKIDSNRIKSWNIYSMMLSYQCFDPEGVECLFRVLDTPELCQSPAYKTTAMQELFSADVNNQLDIVMFEIVKRVVKTIPEIAQMNIRMFIRNSWRYSRRMDIFEFLLMTDKTKINLEDVVRYAVSCNPALISRLLTLRFSLCPQEVLKYPLFLLCLDVHGIILLSDMLHLGTVCRRQEHHLVDHLRLDITMTPTSLKEIEDSVHRAMLKRDRMLPAIDKPIMSHFLKEVCLVLCERRVPSLLEITRDAVRKMLVHCYGQLASRYLKELKLPKPLEDIIACRIPLYMPHLPIPQDLRLNVLFYRQKFHLQYR